MRKILFSLLRRQKVSLESPVNEQELVRMMKRIRITALAYYYVSGISETTRKILKQDAIRQQAFFYSVERELERFNGVFKNDDPVILIKGCVTSRYYDPPFSRPLADIDVLVEREFFDKAMERFLRSGYVVLRRGRFYRWAVLRHHDSTVEVDMICQELLFPNKSFQRLLSSCKHHVPSDEASMVIAVAHMRKSLFENPVVDLMDFYFAMKSAGFHWDEALEILHEFNLQKSGSIACHLLNRWFRIEVNCPPSVIPALLRLKDFNVVTTKNRLLREVLRAWL